MAKTEKETELFPKYAGRGLDIGTMWIASALKDDTGNLKLNKIRDAFLDLESNKTIKQMLKMSNANFIEKGDHIVLVGDRAIDYANIFKREVRRPLQQGVISSSEIDAQEILTIIISELLGKPRLKDEIVYYSIPAEPVDKNQKIIYHEMVFKKILDSLQYKGIALNEAAAIAYSNAAKENFSAVTISFGAGMCNICVMYQALSGLQFSISRGGDWIDTQSAMALGTTASRIATIKETGIDLTDPKKGDPKFVREREAIMFHYRALIDYALDMIMKQFKTVAVDFVIPQAIPLIIAGGTSLAGGFVELFKESFKARKGFPIEISEIRHASDPLYAVVQGLLVAALNHDES